MEKIIMDNITGETGMQPGSVTVQCDVDVSSCITDEELSKRAHIRMAKDLLDDKKDPPLSAYIAAIKTSRGRSDITGTPIPSSYIKKFIDESDPELSKKSNDIEWIVPGLWYRGEILMLAGDPGVGKTSCILSMLKKVSHGNPIFADSYSPTRPLRVLYLNADSSKLVFDNIYNKKMNIDDDTNIKVLNMHEINRLSLEKLGQTFSFENINTFTILSEKIKRESADILIIDTFAAMLTCDENKSKEMIPIMSKLRGWAAENNILLILVHHFRKRDIKNVNNPRTLEDVSGSKSIYGQCDCVMSVESRFDDFKKKIDKSGIINILKDGSAGGLKSFPKIHFDIINESPEKYHVDFFNDDIEDEDQLSSLEYYTLVKINEGLATFKGIFSEMQKYAGSSRSTIKRAITSLKTTGCISATGHTCRTVYNITDIGLSKITKIVDNNIIDKSVEQDEFSLEHDPEEENRMEIARLNDEIEELSAWDLSYENAPLDMKEKIDEFRSIDEWTGYEDLKDTYDYRMHRMESFTTKDDFTHEMLFIEDENNSNNRLHNELISRKKLNYGGLSCGRG
jgi:hypothetical protein